jgi:adenylate cyclase
MCFKFEVVRSAEIMSGLIQYNGTVFYKDEPEGFEFELLGGADFVALWTAQTVHEKELIDSFNKLLDGVAFKFEDTEEAEEEKANNTMWLTIPNDQTVLHLVMRHLRQNAKHPTNNNIV